MVVYKVYSKNYEFKRAEPMGMLVERRRDLRGMDQVESGLRWARSAFGHLVKNRQTIFVVPDEWNLGAGDRVRMEKEIFTKEEFLEMMKVMDQETKGKGTGYDEWSDQ
jgi:hypothetical protein